jgi:arylsulfatase A-like enzyme
MTNTTLSRRSFIASAGCLAVASRGSAAQPSAAKPNIVFILADDLGYADLSVYGRREYRTPNIDSLAAGGLRFTQAYSNSAVCSATRFALITGRYQYRLRGGLEEPIHRPNPAIGLPPSVPTLPSLLKRVGYDTALIGKWHLGFLPHYGPLKSGYDEFFGNYGGALDYFSHRGTGDAQTAPKDLYEGEVPVERAGYYTNLLADRAVEYVRRKHSQPFFLSLHFTAPHWPWEGPTDAAVSKQLKDIWHWDGGNLDTYARMVRALDDGVGRVLAELDAQGLSDNTIVVFTSDNGGERFSDNWPFTGQKSELLEGGIRVPAIVRWPVRVRRGTTDQVAITMDWLPTLLDVAGAKADPAFPSDGDTLLPTLTGDRAAYARTLYWRYASNEQRALRVGDLKYLKIRDNEYLFDLARDVRERANLASLQPQKLAELRRNWEHWNEQMLPITADVFTGGPSRQQADRNFVPAAR